MESQRLLRAAERKDPSLVPTISAGYTSVSEYSPGAGLWKLRRFHIRGGEYQGSGEHLRGTDVMENAHRVMRNTKCLRAMGSTHRPWSGGEHLQEIERVGRHSKYTREVGNTQNSGAP